jgi:acyl-CoA thioesterase-1
MLFNRGFVAVALGLLLLTVDAIRPASAAQVVAIGASNTIGTGQGRNHSGVAPSEAWPAQLEQLLHARGISVVVRNAGLAGDTTCGMLSRLDGEIGSDTKVVIIQPGGNDGRKGGCQFDAARNVAEMQQKLRARRIKSILLTNIVSIAGKSNLGVVGQHFNRAGHAAVAAWLLPKVAANLR